MTAERSTLENAFETTLTAEMGPNDLTASVASIGSLTSPCILVIEPESDTRREFVRFDGVFGASSFVTTNIAKRYLPGSAVGSNITHPNGALVASVATQQHVEDLHDRVDATDADVTALEGVVAALDHNTDLANVGTGDVHTQYLRTDGTRPLTGVQTGVAPTSDLHLSTKKYVDDKASDYAPATHVDSTDGHPVVTTVADGLMLATDKVKLDSVEADADETAANNAATATKLATARTIDITGDITATAVAFDGSQNIAISAAVNNDSHTHDTRYYTESQVDALLDDAKTLYRYDDLNSATNIGTSLVALTLPSLAAPGAGLILLNWQIQVERTGDPGAASIAVYLRRDGVNLGADMRMNYVDVTNTIPNTADEGHFAGSGYEVLTGASTDVWSLMVLKTSTATFSIVAGNMTALFIPA